MGKFCVNIRERYNLTFWGLNLFQFKLLVWTYHGRLEFLTDLFLLFSFLLLVDGITSISIDSFAVPSPAILWCMVCLGMVRREQHISHISIVSGMV